jgi:twitching motility two-component system response regulator PilG
MSQEFSPIQLLTKLSCSEFGGCLEVSNGEISWQIHLEGGLLHSALCSIQTLAQIDYHLRVLGYDAAVAGVKAIPASRLENSSDHPFEDGLFNRVIAWLGDQQLLGAEQQLRLTESLVKETLESCLWLNQGTSRRIATTNFGQLPLPPLDGLDLRSLLASFQQRLIAWQRMSPTIGSPHQRPYLAHQSVLQQPVLAGAPSTAMIEKLAKLMKGLSIRQLAFVIKQDELKLTQLLLPYVQQGAICLRDPQPPFDRLPRIPVPPAKKELPSSRTRVSKIVCIDDSPTILDEISHFLGNERFQVSTVENPMKALSALHRVKPDLILMDITMPGLNGYQLCSLLRKSNPHFETIPIIMVTGHRGLIDRAKAKLAGATDYLTKPFTQESLLDIVQKYLS